MDEKERFLCVLSQILLLTIPLQAAQRKAEECYDYLCKKHNPDELLKLSWHDLVWSLAEDIVEDYGEK